jgi:hypothetical protein
VSNRARGDDPAPELDRERDFDLEDAEDDDDGDVAEDAAAAGD